MNEFRQHYSKPNFLPLDSETSQQDWFFMGGAGPGAPVHVSGINLLNRNGPRHDPCCTPQCTLFPIFGYQTSIYSHSIKLPFTNKYRCEGLLLISDFHRIPLFIKSKLY